MAQITDKELGTRPTKRRYRNKDASNLHPGSVPQSRITIQECGRVD